MKYNIPTPDEAEYPTSEFTIKKVIPLVIEAINSKKFTFQTDIEFSVDDLNIILKDYKWVCKRISNREGVYYTLTPYKKPVNSESYWEK